MDRDVAEEDAYCAAGEKTVVMRYAAEHPSARRADALAWRLARYARGEGDLVCYWSGSALGLTRTPPCPGPKPRVGMGGYSCRSGVYAPECPEHGDNRPGQTVTVYRCASGCGEKVEMAAQQCAACRAQDVLEGSGGPEPRAVKYDNEKPRMGLLPPDVLVLVAKVFTYGAKKYGAWNWTNGFAWSRLNDAGQRHILAWSAGENVDPESGLPHLGHALCCYMMLAAHELRGLGIDDRHVIAPRT